MLQSGDISYFLFQGVFLILPHFEPNDYHCSGGVHFEAEYVFFSGKAPSF